MDEIDAEVEAIREQRARERAFIGWDLSEVIGRMGADSPASKHLIAWWFDLPNDDPPQD